MEVRTYDTDGSKNFSRLQAFTKPVATGAVVLGLAAAVTADVFVAGGALTWVAGAAYTGVWFELTTAAAVVGTGYILMGAGATVNVLELLKTGFRTDHFALDCKKEPTVIVDVNDNRLRLHIEEAHQG